MHINNISVKEFSSVVPGQAIVESTNIKNRIIKNTIHDKKRWKYADNQSLHHIETRKTALYDASNQQ